MRIGRGLCPLLLVAIASGCGSTARHHSGTVRSASAKIPNPFTIIARYSAVSLGLRQPLDLAVAPDGDVYVTDASDRVTVVTPAGKALRRWGKRGSGRGEFSFADPSDPSGNLFAPIAVGPEGKVYVADRGNHRVEVFSSTGKFIRQFGSYGAGRGQFIVILGLTVDSAGNVYVSDDQQQTVSKFSPAGRFDWSIGGPATTDPDLQGGFALANVDAHGRVVAGVNGRSIIYIDASGHKADAFPVSGYFRDDWAPCDVTVDSHGDVAVESCPDAGHPVPGVPSYRATLLFDPTHHLIGAWYGSPFSNFVGPQFGPRGEVFAMSAELHTGHPDGSILKLKVAMPGA